MFFSLVSFGLEGIDAYKVDVEIDTSRKMPAFDIVGMGDMAVRESRDRVKSAIINSGYNFPVSKIVVNLAPARIKKYGPLFDMPIFLGIIAASFQAEINTDGCGFVGELSLNGCVRAVNGVLPIAIKAKEDGLHSLFVPKDNSLEASVVEGINVFGVESISEVVDHLTGTAKLEPCTKNNLNLKNFNFPLDYEDVKGQQIARRAIEIAAAGFHNILLIGPPGTGKSMLSKRIPSILPTMTFEEAIDTTKIHSVAGNLSDGTAIITHRPFRSPHHTVSPVALSGGGSHPLPGEVSLAHNGVLFLDEFPEFTRQSMEVLRQPLEDGVVTISRASGRTSYPCSFMLVAAMNPCPCGYKGHPSKPCSCSESSALRYINKISGPLLDRMDLQAEVMPVEFDELSSNAKSESSGVIKERVERARDIQHKRYNGSGIYFNSQITPAMLHQYCTLEENASELLKTAFERMGLSARAYDRILKVARTIADLADSKNIKREHIAEALQYRSLDRKYWNR